MLRHLTKRNINGVWVGFALAAMMIAAPGLEAQLHAQERLSLDIPSDQPPEKCMAIGNEATSTRESFIETFNDDFNSLDLKSGKWTPHYDGGYDWVVKRTLQGNREQQLYVDPGYKGNSKKPLGLNPFEIKDGVLSIVGQRTPDDKIAALYGYRFTSGLLTTRKSFAQTYGYFEMRAKIPSGKALWPAFWLLPTDKTKWPPEIDILEVVGQQPDLMVMTAHWKKGGTGAYSKSGCRNVLPTASTAFHQFGLLWAADELVWYIDRRPVQVLKTPPGMDIPMYLLVNMAIGGNMVGVADDGTPLPSSFDVDYIRAFKPAPQ